MYLLFLIAWIIFNGNFTLEIFILGILVAAVMLAFMCKFMDHSIKREIGVYKKSVWFIQYVALLILEIIKANLAIIPRILTVEEEMDPVIVKFKTSLKSDFTRVLLANAITLTPGTITVALEDDEYTIHCLDETLAEGLADSNVERLLKKLDEEE